MRAQLTKLEGTMAGALCSSGATGSPTIGTIALEIGGNYSVSGDTIPFFMWF